MNKIFNKKFNLKTTQLIGVAKRISLRYRFHSNCCDNLNLINNTNTSLACVIPLRYRFTSIVVIISI